MDMAAKPKGTQPGHVITDHSSHTKPVKIGSNNQSTVDDSENKLKQKLKSGENLDKARQEVAKQTGNWPNGATN